MYAPLLTTTFLLLLVGAERAAAATYSLFQPWNASDWIASDDTVRGGLSESSLEIVEETLSSETVSVARFYGTLDYEALNGSGFASQRTVDDWPEVDLSAYDRLVLEVAVAAGSAAKTFSFNVKDTVASVNGVEQASVSWEHDFQVANTIATEGATNYEQIEVLFEDLVPTYRGSVQNDTEPLDLTSIKRFNIMIRR